MTKSGHQEHMDYIDTGIEQQLVDNPGTGYAQFVAEAATLGPSKAGKVAVLRNMRTLVGGVFEFVDQSDRDDYKKRPARLETARLAKAAWERAEPRGAKAVDPGALHVDGGYRDPEAFVGKATDATALKTSIEAFLSPSDLERFTYVVVGEHGRTAYAKRFPGTLNKPNTHQIQKSVREFLVIIDRLALFLDISAIGASRGTRVQRDDAPQTFVGTVSSRRVA